MPLIAGGWKSSFAAASTLRDHVDPAAFAIERHDTGDQREEGVVLAATDVAAGVVLGATLPHQDAAGHHGTAAVALDAEPFAVRFAAIANRALTFLVCHRCLTGMSRARSASKGFLRPCSRCYRG